MTQARDQDDLPVRYLLGALAEAEQTRLEDEYFARDDSFEQLLAAEDDLIDAYVCGELSADEHARFAARLLATPRQRERVAFARMLLRSDAPTQTLTDAPPAPARHESSTWWRSLLALFARQPVLSFSFAAVVLALVCGGAWLAIEQTGRRARLASEQAAQQKSPQPPPPPQTSAPAGQQQQPAAPSNAERAATPSPQLEQPRATRVARAPALPPRPIPPDRSRAARTDGGAHQPALPPRPIPPDRSAVGFLMRGNKEIESARTVIVRSAIASLLLSPELIRGAGVTNRLSVPAGTDAVRLQVNLSADDYKSYRAIVQTVAGRNIWRGVPAARPASAGAKVVTMQLPARLLRPGDYILTLSGLHASGRAEDIGEYYFQIEKK